MRITLQVFVIDVGVGAALREGGFGFVAVSESPAQEPDGIDDLNAYNERLRLRVMERGRFYIVQATLADGLFLRSCVQNPLTTEAQFAELLDEIRTAGAEVLEAGATA